MAAPTISRIAPVSDAVCTSIGSSRATVELPVDQQAGQRRIDDADGGDLGRGGDAADHGAADQERQRQRGNRDQEAAADLAQAGARRRRAVLAARAPADHARTGSGRPPGPAAARR